MTDTEWTPSLVAERLMEAADVLKRLPKVKVPGFFSTWPQIVPEFSDLVGQEPISLHHLPPTTEAISRMEETLGWTIGLDVIDARIIWLRAYGDRWKEICAKVGKARSTVNEHWLYALCIIAFRLNGRPFQKNLSRRHVIRTMYLEKDQYNQGGQKKSVWRTFS